MKSVFQQKLNKYRRGQLPKQEEEKMHRWVDSLSTPQHEANITWSEADQAALLQNIKNNMNTPNKKATPITPQHRFWLKVAAGLVLLAVATWLIIPQFMPSPVLSVTPVTEPNIRKAVLSDGTLVWLKGDSKLTYTELPNAAQRQAVLTGEALFEVAKNPNKPFIIQCNDVSIRVVGTSFSLRADTTGIQLKVLTGKVHVVTPHDVNGMEVSPNEQITYVQGKTHKAILTAAATRNIIGYNSYSMNFTKVSMKDIIKRIEQKFDVSIKVSDQQLYACNLTADFTDKSLPATLAMLTQMLDIQYTITATTVNITGQGCQVQGQ